MLAYDFFLLLFFSVFLSHHAGWQFLFLFLFLHVYSTVNATSLITNLLWKECNAGVKESNIHSLSSPKKKAAKRWPCYSGEWKQVNICVFFCVEALALRNKEEKKEVEGRRDRERERETSKKKKGGVKASLNDFFAQGKIGERQTTVWTFQGGDTLVTSSTHFPSFTRLSDKSPPLPNASHEGTRNVSYRSSSLCCRTACSWRVEGKLWRLVCLSVPVWLQYM